MPTSDSKLTIDALLFERITALDAIGPYEVLQRLLRAQMSRK